MDFNTVANLAEIISAVLVIGGLAFGMLQIHDFRVQRRAQAAIEVVRSFNTPEFVHALRVVLSQPGDMTARDCQACSTDFEESSLQLSFTLEAVGLMVHRHMVALPMVWELMGGVVLDVWQRLEPWSQTKRAEYGNPKFNEWSQWLAERLAEYNACCPNTPAHELYADWKPREQGPLA